MMTYEVRDPIHRTITFDDTIRHLVDHPWVQRLRHIRQLGFVSQVYPGAVHDRFQHSLGVMHLASAAFADLCEGFRKELADFTDADLSYAHRVLEVAGLLHDVGHAPFSHTAEEYFPQVAALALSDDWYHGRKAPTGRQGTHEDATLKVLERFAASGVCDEDLARDAAAVLSSEVVASKRLQGKDPLIRICRALVSGELDADRCDYLLRDSHFTGVSYGVYDLDRLRSCLAIVPGPDGPELGLDVHGVHAFESLLLARYHMFLQVYFHKVPPAFEYYLAQAIAGGEVFMDFKAGLSDIVDMRDDAIWAQLHEAANQGGEWSRRIVRRDPAVLVMRERVGEGGADNIISMELISRLQEAGCHVFWRNSKQKFSKLAIGGQKGARMLCARRLLGKTLIEDITLHSHLLDSFNQSIDVQHTYVLREDADRARGVMDRMTRTWPRGSR